MRIDVLTLFPDFFAASAEVGVVGRAIRGGLLDLQCHNPRDFTVDKPRSRKFAPWRQHRLWSCTSALRASD
jgi:tRNA (guanine37-N1)-methyltransferase